MDKDKFFEDPENTLKDVGDKRFPATLKVTISYSTGERDVFNVSEIFRANSLVATKNRNKYLYFQNHLINLEHVVKMQYENLDTNI